MIIGHYSPSVFAQGGIGRYIQRLAVEQKKGGHSVVYFSRVRTEASETCTVVSDDNDLYENAHRQGLDILHLHKEVEVVPPASLGVVRTMHGNQASCPSGSRYLSRRGRVCNRKYSRTVCTWGHIVDGCGSSKPARMAAHFDRIQKEKKVLPEVQTVTVSEFLRSNMIREGYPPDRVTTLLSPAPEVKDPAGPVDREGVPRIVFLGRLVEQKGIDWLIKAMSRVKSNCVLDVAGEGYYMREAKKLAAQRGLTEKIVFHGWVEASTASSLIRASRAVVFPSVWHEPAGLVTLEAAAYGRPVITSKVGGIPEYAHTSFAELVDPHDEAGLAAAIDKLCIEPDTADKMGRAGRHYVVSNHSFDQFLTALFGIYTKVLE